MKQEEKEVETVQDKAQAINKKLFCTCGATLSDCREMFDQGGRCCPNCTHNLTKSKKEDTAMSKKISKKADRIAKAQAQKSAKEVEEKETEKASEAATINTPAPTPQSVEEKIVAENIAKGDEATMTLLEGMRKCPKCNMDNTKDRVTCLSCGERLSTKRTKSMEKSKINQLKTKKAAAAAKVKAEKKDKVPRYARKDSVADAILELVAFTEDELIKKADALIVENGGSSNVKESKTVVGFILPALIRLGVVTAKASEGKDVGVTYLYNPKS
jgi:hypothetical protein